MLGLARATLLSSVAFVKQSYAQMVEALKPVAYWHLGEAGGLTIFDEKGVQHGTYEGTTQGMLEYGLEPIVENSIGSSVGFDGTHTYGQIPHNQAFELPSYTIDFAFQADSGPAVGQNRVLFSKDLVDPAPSGAVSIEILNNAGQLRLRAYAGGAAGSPIWIGGPGGAADLQLGKAYKVTVTVDATAGAKLYLDGAERASASSATVGWTANNTEPFVLGAYSIAALGKFDGVMDEVALFARALASGDVVKLAQARTISRPIGISSPVVPRTDVWLTNDDQNPATLGSTLRYAAPGASGNGLSPGTPGSLATLLSGASAGWVIVCAQGYYDMPNGLTIPSGASASNPVTVVAAQGAWVVICQDIDLMKLPNIDAGAGRPSEAQWTLFDAAHNIWRVPYTGTTGSEGVSGIWHEGGCAHYLLPYPSVAAMQASQGGDLGGSAIDSVGTPQTRFVYWGPGVTCDGSFAYIRFERPNWTDLGHVDGTYGAWPDDDRWTLGIEGETTPRKWFVRSNAGDFRTGRPVLPNPLNETPNSNGSLPSGRNPNNARIYLARAIVGRYTINSSSGQFIRIGSGINCAGYYGLMDGRRNVEVHRGVDWVWGGAIEEDTQQAQNITYHRRRIVRGEWRMVAGMAAFKFNIFLSPPDQAWEVTKFRADTFMVANAGGFLNITFDNCSIYGFHEIFVGGLPGFFTQTRFVNCCFMQGYDEFIQAVPHTVRQLDVGYCYFRDAPFGFGVDGGPEGTQSPYGSVFMHHNIIDNRFPRGSFAGNRPINGGGQSIARPNASNTAMKFYNNTYIQGPDDAGDRASCMANQCNARLSSNGSGRVQYSETFNNIHIRHDTKRYAKNEGGSTAPSDGLENDMLIAATNNYYRDYNCYSRHGLPFRSGASGYSDAKYHTALPSNNTFQYVRAVPSGEPAGSVFFGSSAYNTTKTMQALAHPQGRGFDDNSTDENPQVPSQTNFPTSRMDYRPQALSVVSAPATPPSETNWWTSPGWTSYGATPVPFNMAPSAWKGALDPNGSTVPIGVQNP